eukprot:SM005260S17850  [mRNA]  locus=s5260:21:374:- [translate_table: standard]
MTNTWRRSPGAQPPHQQAVRRLGGNVRQRSASSALRLPQGGSRAGAPALAPPPAVARGRASARPLRVCCTSTAGCRHSAATCDLPS